MSGGFSRFGLGVGAGLGRLAYLLGFRRRVALDGLRRAFPALSEPQRRRIARAAYGQLGRSLAEVALARTVPDSDLEHLVRFPDLDRLLAARAQGRGVVVAVAHFGNWELLARAGARRGLPITAITRPLRGAANRQLLAARREGGMRELPDKNSLLLALDVLRRGEFLAIVVDQNMRPSRGIFVDFFGEQACTTPVAAVLALRAGAPLLAAFPLRQPDGTHLVEIQGPFETSLRGHAAVVALTQEVTRAVEEMVRAHPDHWFWVHRRWKTRPSLAPGSGP
ncbi:MAG: lysophospholipid acyltransferase family protein [Myxococcales bacterium]